jgi:hypothetical protein
MDYNTFIAILNETIFDKSKADLIEKIAKYPERYIGLFRPTKPKAKLLQNLLQSHEIRFGDALEKIIEKFFEENGFIILEKIFFDHNEEELTLDQFLLKDNTYYFIEQKVRDDHDSSKKRGQIDNFERKIETIIQHYSGCTLKCYFYFVDPDFKKNKNFYTEALSELSNDYGVSIFLCYGRELFDELNIPNTWDEIISFLKHWKNEIPELPEINFDLDSEHTFNEIKELPVSIFRKLFSNDKIFNEVMLTLFPKKKVLKMLFHYFKTKKDGYIYKRLVEILEEKGVGGD